MKLTTILAALVVPSSALFADDVAAVTPVTPVATVWTIQPVTIQLIAVLNSPIPAPERIRALVAALTPSQIASVVFSIQDNPRALSALVAAMTPAQAASVLIALQRNPASLSALASIMTPEQAANAMAALQGSPRALAAFVAQFDAGKLAAIQVRLFVADINAWAALADFLGQPEPAKPFANWLVGARSRLATRIAREGYTPDLLAETRKLMQEAIGKAPSP